MWSPQVALGGSPRRCSISGPPHVVSLRRSPRWGPLLVRSGVSVRRVPSMWSIQVGPSVCPIRGFRLSVSPQAGPLQEVPLRVSPQVDPLNVVHSSKTPEGCPPSGSHRWVFLCGPSKFFPLRIAVNGVP